MSLKLNSFNLPDNTIKKMEDELFNTRNAHIELGFSLCKDRNDQEILDGPHCTGESCSFDIPTSCRTQNEVQIGVYHTHPIESSFPSPGDTHLMCNYDVSCIGSATYNTIRCYTRKNNDIKSCRSETIDNARQSYFAQVERKNIKDSLKNPRSIIKPGIPRLIRSIIENDNKIVKTLNDNRILLNKYFNEFRIK